MTRRNASVLCAFILWTFLAIAFASCKPHGPSTDATLKNITSDARLLRIYEMRGGELVQVINPWDTTALLGSYFLTENEELGADVKKSLPSGTAVIRVPLRRSGVFGTVHLGALDELDALSGVAAVADVPYIGLAEVKDRVSRGEITDLGSSMSPSLEKIIALQPDALLVSPYNNTGYGVMENAGVPIIAMADYMEQTPLGRAEWIRFIGRLYGRAAQADSVFAEVKTRYNALKITDENINRPKVITEQVADGYWFVPGGKSYMARMLADAGAAYPWADDTQAGSLQLDFAAVLSRGADADFWLIKTYGNDLTLSELEAAYPLNNQIKAFSSHGVYACNTAVSPLFDEFPFHPELLLQDYIAIFSGQADRGLRYFKPVI